MKISGVIFDLNGTVLSDEDEYGEAFGNVLDSLGVKEHSKYPQTKGIGVEKNWENLIEKYDIKTEKSIVELVSETQKEYVSLLGKVTLNYAFEEFVKDLNRAGIKSALATSNTWYLVEMVFDKFAIEAYFDVVTTAEEVKNNKPDPEIFLITAEKLALNPATLVVFEDSAAGIKAAKEAGMYAVGISDPRFASENLEEADLLIEDFSFFVIP